MGQILNIQNIAANVYEMVNNINQSIIQMVGLDAVWCRLLPYDNGEDVIVQEYTLHQYECPHDIKIITENNSFNVGNFSIDLFGIKNSEQLEISIDKGTWENVYGYDSIPQKGDFVLIPLLHRPYEVVSSTAVHTIGQKITSWKCILGEWKHTASRAESEEFKISIDELTNAQDRLFGETISKEVADAVNDVETAYNTTTYVDPFKDFSMNSIIVDDIMNIENNIISSAYYDFSKANKPVTYKIQATYDTNVKENKWIYSCWFNCNNTPNAQTIKLSLQTKDNDFWYFNLKNIKHKLSFGQTAAILRGSQIVLDGIIDTDGCDNNWVIKISASECLKTNKKFPKFWENGIWKLKTEYEYNLFTAYNNKNTVLKLNLSSDNIITFKCDTINKTILVKNLNLKIWNYIAFEISPSSLRIIIVDSYNKIITDEKIPINIKTFSFDSAAINNIETYFNITNIRLFENEYELGDAYKQDMYSQVVRNASKLILVDTPKAPNNMSFKSPIR